MGYFGTTQCPFSGFHGEYDIYSFPPMPLYGFPPKTTHFPWGVHTTLMGKRKHNVKYQKLTNMIQKVQLLFLIFASGQTE